MLLAGLKVTGPSVCARGGAASGPVSALNLQDSVHPTNFVASNFVTPDSLAANSTTLDPQDSSIPDLQGSLDPDSALFSKKCWTSADTVANPW